MFRRIFIVAMAVMVPLNALAHGIGEHAEREAPGLTEIVGGIGWIVGILGFMAYLKSRKK